MVDLSPPKSLKEPSFTPIEGIKLRFDINEEEIKALCDELIERGKKINDDIANLKPEECNFDNVFKALGLYDSWSSSYSSCIYFPQYVSTHKKLREASGSQQQRLSEFGINEMMREDLYASIKAAAKNTDLNSLCAEDKRLVEKTLLERKRSGLDLPKEKRDQLKELYNRLSELSIKFSKAVNEDTTSIKLTREELEGLPADFIDNLESEDNSGSKNYIVTMKYPDVVPVLESATKAEVRKKVEFVYGTRCEDNVPLLEEAIQLRLKAAKLLGYKTHADYVLEEKMAKNHHNVQEFLDLLRGRLADIGKNELPTLLKVKKEKDSSANEIFSYDISYCKKELLKNYFNVDNDKIKEYFPVDHVTDKMLEIYQDVLNLDFERVEKDPQNWNKITPEDVKLIRVKDRDSKELMGYFYLDLFPREGKYSHAACFPLQPGCEQTDGTRQIVVAAMVANFSKPTANAPSLLKHDELTTYFHELGHVMHTICSKVKWARFHGTSVEGDFVEAPSQMLENWCWNEQILNTLSSHYKTKEHIPKELTSTLIASKNVGSGMFYLRQLFFGIFDLQIHSIEKEDKVDTSALYLSLRKEISLVGGQPGTFAAATFGHVMGGYDAGYYGYLWSEVFSADMFATKFKTLSNIAAPKAGLSYRKEILQPGSSKDGMDMLKCFLGREPTNEAFLNAIIPPTVQFGSSNL